MARFVLFLSCLVLASASSADRADPVRSFSLSLPPKWRDATNIRLVVEGMTVARNQALKLRVTAIGSDGPETFLGSAGVPASGGNAAIEQLPPIRIDVTRALKGLPGSLTKGDALEIRIRAVDGRNEPLADLKWEAHSVRLQIN